MVPLMIEHREAVDVATPVRAAREDPASAGYGEESRPGATVAGQVGHVIILRDITESRRTAQPAIESERVNALTLLDAGVAHATGNPSNLLHIQLQLMQHKARE